MKIVRCSVKHRAPIQAPNMYVTKDLSWGLSLQGKDTLDLHHLRNYTGGQSINIRKREDWGQTQTSLWDSNSYCRAVTIIYFLMDQWSCRCWVGFHFEIFWAEFHPQYFRLLSTSSEYSVRLFTAGSGTSHRIKIKLTGWDFYKSQIRFISDSRSGTVHLSSENE